ncbi:hypothetical protein AKJ40_02235 [candidate division MSBL1 archaeon SCGC-AAA259M10]|uniref:2-dehydropantoate 2-reductase n=2 Tax=candidate division MSBL1 TaxID=215777 RepID=A0A133U6Z3_9EURY|nr:hypothetical protein AKJ61_01800 [candidate division MSBL1 archaeon SCGC-AAA259B11]KXA99914.1 hypothetical protein AKJ40_02235 [candidate division MSBL1 archaeon SCGC-AAA259M10]
MNITVLGSGAMGSLFGGLLTADGHDLTLVDVWKEHIETMKERGLVISTPEGTERNIEVEATADPSSIGNADLVIVFVKSYQTKEALQDTSGFFDENVDVLTLQNGLGNPETISEYVPEKNIIAGVTAHGSTLKNPGHIIHAGVGPTKIGRYFTENDEKVSQLSKILTSAGFETEVTERIREEIWEKLLVNVGINPPTALARVRNGLLVETEAGEELIETIVNEALQVAVEEGVNVREDIVNHVKNVASSTSANKSSMLQDIEAGKKTEIEYLTGSIVRRAEKHDIEVPINRTLKHLVELSERTQNGT